jgi:hypothetical protein
MKIVKQGVLAVGSNIVFTGATSKTYTIESIMLNNPLAYNVEIKRFDHLANTTITLCSLTLDAWYLGNQPTIGLVAVPKTTTSSTVYRAVRLFTINGTALT